MEIRETLLAILEANGIYIDRKDTGNDMDLRDYITDSIQFINFIVEIEQEYSIEFPDDVLLYDNIASLNGFASIIEFTVTGQSGRRKQHEPQ
jgi:acyl carrier protein